MRHPLAMLALLLLLNFGCSPRPSAPVLDNNPVYTNKEAGIRFLVPEGWSQQSKSILPPGPLDKRELTLVLYRSFNPSPASFEVSCRDIDESVEIGEFLAKRKRSGIGWTRVGSPEPVHFDQTTGTRYVLEGKPIDRKLTMEVVVVRKGPRVYFLAGTFPANDPIRRAQVRQFLEGLTWMK